MQETWVLSLSWADLLEKEMATHSSVLAWRITWTEESGGLQSMGWQRVWHDWATNTLLLYLHTFCAHGKITGSKYKRMVVWEFLPVGLSREFSEAVTPCRCNVKIRPQGGACAPPMTFRRPRGGASEQLERRVQNEQSETRTVVVPRKSPPPPPTNPT